VFQLGGIVVAIVDVLLGLLLWRRLRGAFPRRRALITALCAAGFLLVAHPALCMAVGSWSGMRALQRHLPESLSMMALGAQVGLLLYPLLLGVATGARAVIRAIRRTRAATGAEAVEAPATETQTEAAVAVPNAAVAVPKAAVAVVDEGRRRVVVAAGWALPAAAVAVSLGGVLASRQRPTVVRLALPVRRELTSLHGVTIAQLSDVHVGNFMDADRLDEIRDAMNALRADIHVITGDLLDNHVSQLELSTRLLRGLRPAKGQLFCCMGNHEYIAARSADVGTIVSGLEEAGAEVLIDEAREVRLGGDRLWMGAIDHPSRPGRERARRPTREGLERALGQMQDDGAPRVLLSHHPRTFVEARDLPFDLMLSGHTHGGQLSLGRIGDSAITPLLPVEFYHNGTYEHRGRRLHVNAGVRINCPPEITLVELVPA